MRVENVELASQLRTTPNETPRLHGPLNNLGAASVDRGMHRHRASGAMAAGRAEVTMGWQIVQSTLADRQYAAEHEHNWKLLQGERLEASQKWICTKCGRIEPSGVESSKCTVSDKSRPR